MCCCSSVRAHVTHGKRLTPGTEGGGGPVPPVCTMGGPKRGRGGLKPPPGGARCEPKPGTASGRRRLRPGEPPAHGTDKHQLGSTGATGQDVRARVRIAHHCPVASGMTCIYMHMQVRIRNTNCLSGRAAQQKLQLVACTGNHVDTVGVAQRSRRRHLTAVTSSAAGPGPTPGLRVAHMRPHGRARALVRRRVVRLLPRSRRPARRTTRPT